MGDALRVSLATTVAMVLVLVVAGAVLSFVAFPYRGRTLPWRKHAGGQGNPGH
ncbi:MAG TPA: hypothetical protein VFT70_06550 [Nocardioides sp.]|nr:hypothetical protein [Nocardioides sp.]